jgi:hypothetical protein
MVVTPVFFWVIRHGRRLCKERVFDFPDGLFRTDGEFEVFFLLGLKLGLVLVWKGRGGIHTVILSQYLYTIITLRSIHSVKKNNPSM